MSINLGQRNTYTKTSDKRILYVFGQRTQVLKNSGTHRAHAVENAFPHSRVQQAITHVCCSREAGRRDYFRMSGQRAIEAMTT
jgi:hypothetical protein